MQWNADLKLSVVFPVSVKYFNTNIFYKLHIQALDVCSSRWAGHKLMFDMTKTENTQKYRSPKHKSNNERAGRIKCLSNLIFELSSSIESQVFQRALETVHSTQCYLPLFICWIKQHMHPAFKVYNFFLLHHICTIYNFLNSQQQNAAHG